MKKGRSSKHTSADRDYSLPRAKILKGKINFQRLFEQGTVVYRNRYVNLRFRLYPNADSVCLMGFIVKKKLGKAVNRNRVKRILKEVYRLNQHALTELVESPTLGFHGALMANTIDLTHEQARQSIVDLLDKARSYILSMTDSDS